MNHQDAPSGANATASTTATLAPVVMAERAAAPPIMPPPPGLHDPKEVMRREGRKRRSYCGPWALMAITGRPYADIRARINRVRFRPPNSPVRGTYPSELADVLRGMRYRVSDHFSSLPGHAPTLAALLRGRTSREKAADLGGGGGETLGRRPRRHGDLRAAQRLDHHRPYEEAPRPRRPRARRRAAAQRRPLAAATST